MVCSAQTYTYLASRLALSKPTKTSFQLSLVSKEDHRVRPKTISEPMVHLAQTMHLSCTNTNNVSKCTKMRFHMTHVT
jgi:hypothetical protein